MHHFFCLILIFISITIAHPEHRPTPGEDNSVIETPNVLGDAGKDRLILINPSKKEKNKKLDSETHKEAKGGKSTAQVPMEAAGHPLVIFAGDEPNPDKSGAAAQALFQKAAVKRKVPGVRILEVIPLSQAKLENVFLEARTKKPENTSLINSALLVVNSKADFSEPGWAEAVQKLSRSIFGAMLKTKLETVLLTSNSGAIQCKQFPGAVFGMTAEGVTRQSEIIRKWTTYQTEREDVPFPLSALEWYGSWAFTNKLSRRRYFVCPTKNLKGYQGYKVTKDLLDDEGKVQLDPTVEPLIY